LTASGIVLAGGRSSRFGSPKLLALVDGVPLLDRAVQAVAQVVDEVVIVGPAAGDVALTDLDGLPARVRVEVVRDPAQGGGPLVGLRTGLATVTGDRVVVVGGDMPRLEPGVLHLLLERLEPGVRAAPRATGSAVAADPPASSSPDAVVLGQTGGGRPLPMALRTSEARHAVESAIKDGEASLRAALARLTVEEVAHAEWRRLDPAGRTLLDVDTPADLENAR
jgi:molybdopterin-guanine dinucleotide biosynthesis protein A